MLRVTDIIRDCGIVDTTYFTDEARDRGTAVHAATQLSDEGRLDEDSIVDPIISDRLQGYRNWRVDMPWWRIDLREFECKHPLYGYVGHPDILAHNLQDPFEAVIDIKPPGEMDWHGLQLAAYQRAIVAEWDAHGSIQRDNHLPLRRFNLYLGAGIGRNYKLVPRTEPKDWNVFYAAYVVAKFKEGR